VELVDFHLLLAETGVPIALCGDLEFIGVENECLAWVTSGCVGGMLARPVPGVWTFARPVCDSCRLLTGVDT
jgi:hypothetical protein